MIGREVACACVALALVGCGGGDEPFSSLGGSQDAGNDGSAEAAADVLAEGGQDAGKDAAEGEDGPFDASFPALDAGSFTVFVPSDAAPDGGIAVRVFHPSTQGRRYVAGAPVVVSVPGGHTSGRLQPEGVNEAVATYGFIEIQWLLPGGSDLNVASGGTFDYRGPSCKRALADVIRYAMGTLPDGAGDFLQDHVAFALPSDVGVVGGSNGGNLAITTFADHGSEIASLAWFAAWESPIGDQAVMVELGGSNSLNPYYVPGTCGVESCPWPGLEDALSFDPTAPFSSLGSQGGGGPAKGLLYLDVDHSGTRDDGEFTFMLLAGPGTASGPNPPPAYYTSVELAKAIEGKAATLFPNGRPPWLASQSEVQAYWAHRDGSLVMGAAHAALPQLLVISIASVKDHAQGQPDHPHVRSHVQGWLDAQHDFVRLNPDAAYLALVSGADASAFPDNDEGQGAPWPGLEDLLEPEEVGGVEIDDLAILAAVLELADRTHVGDRSANLTATLVGTPQP